MMSILLFFYELGRKFFIYKVYDLSAQMAYYFLLSVFPFLFVIYSLIPYLPFNEDYILTLIEPYAPDTTYRLIRNTLTAVLANQNQPLLSLSLVISVWLASMGFQSMKRILNTAYNVHEKESIVRQVIEGLMLTIGFMIVFLFSVVVPVLERTLRAYLVDIFTNDSFHRLWDFIQWGVGSFLIMTFFLLLYYFTPNLRVKVKQVLPGALVATIGWQIISLQFATFVSRNNYTAFYGQLGGIVVLMIWFYMSAMIIIIGGLVNAMIYPIQRSERRSF
ncbi:YihY/virulence factor BrkB family protein [Virgibacillus dokdonensis]|uniref:YihY/virulence factor BrkB family protein n=2 Tax=Virgibacillus dokdonensis TaxID=302167 RepID=A0ABU7VIY3_9BACI